MKKLLTAVLTLSVIGTAQASAIMPVLPKVHPVYVHNHYNAYQSGYRNGKSDAYDHVAKTVFFVGTAVIAGVIIYQLGKESRWTAHDGQVGYRF